MSIIYETLVIRELIGVSKPTIDHLAQQLSQVQLLLASRFNSCILLICSTHYVESVDTTRPTNETR